MRIELETIKGASPPSMAVKAVGDDGTELEIARVEYRLAFVDAVDRPAFQIELACGGRTHEALKSLAALSMFGYGR